MQMNNDRFKFRVWDCLINEYRKEGTVQLSGNGQPFIIDGNMQPQDIDNVIIEQCTGLTDKNGKLIYEGDILRATCSDGTHIDYPVGWWDGAFHLYYIDKEMIAETGTIQFCLRGLVTVAHCIFREVIGNIHEMESEND
jgi:uncharacterized phage protein (TIGR01671 family)